MSTVYHFIFTLDLDAGQKYDKLYKAADELGASTLFFGKELPTTTWVIGIKYCDTPAAAQIYLTRQFAARGIHPRRMVVMHATAAVAA